MMIADIQRAVAAAHEVPIEAMRERDGLGTRSREHAWARQEAMFLCREMCSDAGVKQYRRASYPNLAKHFRRDHATVIHGVRAVTKRIASDAKVRRRIDVISVGLLIHSCATFVLIGGADGQEVIS